MAATGQDFDDEIPDSLYSRVFESDLASRFIRLPQTHLYVARVVGTTGPVKIGRSINVTARLRGIQASGPLELVTTVPEWAFSEHDAHRLFALSRGHGEWFTFTDEMAEWVGALPARYAAIVGLRDRVIRALRLDDAGKKIPRLDRPLAALRLAEIRLAGRMRKLAIERARAAVRLEKERVAEAKRAQIARLQATGCGLCGQRNVPVSVESPTLCVCGSCRSWMSKFREKPDDGRIDAEVKATELRQRATEIETLAARRVANLIASRRHENEATSDQMGTPFEVAQS